MFPLRARNPEPSATLGEPLYWSANFRAIFDDMVDAYHAGGRITVVTGESGAGKTTLAGLFLKHVPPRHAAIARSAASSEGDLLVPLSSELDGGSIAGSTADVVRAQPRPAPRVLVIDDAQDMPEKAFSDLAAILSRNPELRTFLLGRPALAVRLRKGTALGAYPLLYYVLRPLGRRDLAGYLRMRSEAVPTAPFPLTDAAIDLLHRAARGSPPVIDRICDRAFDLRVQRQAQVIDCELLTEAVRLSSGLGAWNMAGSNIPLLRPAANVSHARPSASADVLASARPQSPAKTKTVKARTNTVLGEPAARSNKAHGVATARSVGEVDAVCTEHRPPALSRRWDRAGEIGGTLLGACLCIVLLGALARWAMYLENLSPVDLPAYPGARPVAAGGLPKLEGARPDRTAATTTRGVVTASPIHDPFAFESGTPNASPVEVSAALPISLDAVSSMLNDELLQLHWVEENAGARDSNVSSSSRVAVTSAPVPPPRPPIALDHAPALHQPLPGPSNGAASDGAAAPAAALPPPRPNHEAATLIARLGDPQYPHDPMNSARVVIHYSAGNGPRAAALAERIAARGLEAELRQVAHRISESHVRYFLAEDLPAARHVTGILAGSEDAAVGAPRDFAFFAPEQRDGTLEVWLSN